MQCGRITKIAIPNNLFCDLTGDLYIKVIYACLFCIRYLVVSLEVLEKHLHIQEKSLHYLMTSWRHKWTHNNDNINSNHIQHHLAPNQTCLCICILFYNQIALESKYANIYITTVGQVAGLSVLYITWATCSDADCDVNWLEFAEWKGSNSIFQWGLWVCIKNLV